MVVVQVSVETNQWIQHIHFCNWFAVLETEFLEVTRSKRTRMILSFEIEFMQMNKHELNTGLSLAVTFSVLGIKTKYKPKAELS